MPHRVRIRSGPHAGREGLPHERTAAGQYSVKFDNDEVLWFDKGQIRTLHCTLLNCQAYSDDPAHGYCSQCEARRVGKPAPKPEPPNFLADILKLGAVAAEKTKDLEEIIEVMQKMKSGEIPITRDVVRRLCKQLRDATPKCFGPEVGGVIDEIVQDMEALADGKT